MIATAAHPAFEYLSQLEYHRPPFACEDQIRSHCPGDAKPTATSPLVIHHFSIANRTRSTYEVSTRVARHQSSRLPMVMLTVVPVIPLALSEAKKTAMLAISSSVMSRRVWVLAASNS